MISFLWRAKWDLTRQIESFIKFVETKRPQECDLVNYTSAKPKSTDRIIFFYSSRQIGNAWEYNEMVKVIRKFEIATYLLSAFVFSLSSHALIKASLFSVATCANIASEKTCDRVIYPSPNQVMHKNITSGTYLCRPDPLNFS